jgi:hypothetical protein
LRFEHAHFKRHPLAVGLESKISDQTIGAGKTHYAQWNVEQRQKPFASKHKQKSYTLKIAKWNFIKT